MGFLDDAKDFADKHDDQVDQGIEKGGDFVDDKTGGQYADKVDQGQEFLEGQTGSMPDEAGRAAAQNEGADPAEPQTGGDLAP